jgi:hypothetical protein
MRRVPLVLVVLLLAGCSSSHAIHHGAGKKHLVLAPGTQKTFAAGVLRKGDVVTCGVGGYSAMVQPPGHAVGAGGTRVRGTAGGDIELQTNGDGTVIAKCTK